MVKMYFSDVLEYQRFMGNYSTVVGYGFKYSSKIQIFKDPRGSSHIWPRLASAYPGRPLSSCGLTPFLSLCMFVCCSATTFVVIFLGGSVVKHLGWRIGALATPGTD